MVHQYREIKVSSNFKNSISGIQHRHFSLSSTNVNYSWRTNSTFKTVNKAGLRETNNFSQITCSNRRTMCIDDISNLLWKIASQKHLSLVSQEEILGRHSYYRYGSNEGSTMVARCSQKLEWKAYVSFYTRGTNRNNCKCARLGCTTKYTSCYRNLRLLHQSTVVKFQTVNSSVDGFKILCSDYKKQICPNFIRQHNNSVIFKQSRRFSPITFNDSRNDLCGTNSVECKTQCKISCRQQKFQSRYAFPVLFLVQLVTTSSIIQNDRQNMGTSYSGSFCRLSQYTPGKIQQLHVRSIQFRGRCPGTNRLGFRKQLCKRPFQINSPCARHNSGSRSLCYNNCTILGSSAIVQQITKTVDRYTISSPKQFKNNVEYGNNTITNEKRKLENLCMESAWKNRLIKKEWSHKTLKRFPAYWAKSTLDLYNRNIITFCEFCSKNNIVFPPSDSKYIADFLCFICDKSTKPKSLLNTTVAALQCYYDALGLSHVMSDMDIRKLCSALIKSGTSEPMKRSSVMPIEPFKDMFLSWPENDQLDLQRLSLKVITLLSLALMLRPSDLAQELMCSMWIQKNMKMLCYL